MNVLGLDLSLTSPALAVPAATSCLKTDAKTGDKRFCIIRDWIEYYVKTCRPKLAMVEAVPPYMTNTAGLERIHGIAREVLARYDVPFAYVSPSGLKEFATGRGEASKSEMMDGVEGETGQRPATDDEADAWWLMKMGQAVWADPFFHEGHHLQALSSVVWPLRPRDPNWPRPYGGHVPLKTVTKKCRHKVIALRNGDHWLHPFTLDVCDKPPR